MINVTVVGADVKFSGPRVTVLPSLGYP